MNTVFTSILGHFLKKTLESVITDKDDGIEAKRLFPKVFAISDIDDAYVDDQEIGGPGLATERQEAQNIEISTLKEGATYRYMVRNFGLGLRVSKEAIDDNKYDQAIKAAKRLKLSMHLTAEQDAWNVFVRATNTSYVYGDGKPLASATHPLPHGGTFSNMLATPLSPSRTAVINAVSQIKKYPGHNGLVQYGYMPERVVCPTEQWAMWDGLIKSEFAPEAGQFNEINVVNRLKLKETVATQFWANTTTNWAMTTDADDGLKFMWRERPNSNTWVGNDNRVMNYSIHARWTRGHSNPRGILFSNS